MDELAAIVSDVRARTADRSPVVVGIGGAVAVGKTTIAHALAGELDAQVVSTDSFLLPNAALAARNLAMRKGFPETYDGDEIVRVMHAIRHGLEVEVREYSHRTYDIVPDSRLKIGAGAVVILEGIVALQSPVREHVDVAVYVDADGSAVREWFVRRFVRLVDDARADESSFYQGFTDLDAGQLVAIAEATWDGINGPNLDANIAPSRRHATFVVRKDPGHRIVGVTRVGEG